MYVYVFRRGKGRCQHIGMSCVMLVILEDMREEDQSNAPHNNTQVTKHNKQDITSTKNGEKRKNRDNR